MTSLVDSLRRAHERRAPLAADPRTTAYRVLNAEGDGVDGITVDVLERVCVVSLYRDLTVDAESALLDAVEAVHAPASVYLKRRPREARHAANVSKDQLAPETAARGADVESFEVLENGLRYCIRPAQGLSVGLYLDMRDTRGWLAERVQGRTVLNLFAYTCGFGVAAKSGGASRVLNLDASRRVLAWGEENARLNGQAVDRYDYVAGDAFEWLARLARKGERFDVVIADPPSFANTRASRFSASRDYPALAEAAARVVAPGGQLIACCNLAGLPADRYEALVNEGLTRAGRTGRKVQTLGASPIDFPSPPGHGGALKVRVLELE